MILSEFVYHLSIAVISTNCKSNKTENYCFWNKTETNYNLLAFKRRELASNWMKTNKTYFFNQFLHLMSMLTNLTEWSKCYFQAEIDRSSQRWNILIAISDLSKCKSSRWQLDIKVKVAFNFNFNYTTSYQMLSCTV